MRRAYFYALDKSPLEMWIENTPKTGELELRLHVYDGAIDFCYEDWSEYKNKLPLVIEQDDGAIAVVFVQVKYGDVFLKRELQSGQRQATKIVYATSPVYFIKKPIKTPATEQTVTYNKASNKNQAAIFNYSRENPNGADIKFIKSNGQEENYKNTNTNAFGGVKAVMGTSVIFSAANVEMPVQEAGITKVTTYREFPIATEKEPTEKITGEYEII